MKTIFLFLAIILSATVSKSQSFAKICSNPSSNDTIIAKTRLSSGIYLSRKELKQQTPSITCNYVRRGQSIWFSDPNNGEVKKLKSKDFFGYVENGQLYLSDNIKKPTLESGSYIYYSRKKVKFGYTVALPGFSILPHFYFYDKDLLINVQNGKKMKGSKHQLKKILRNYDPELFVEFKNDKWHKKNVQTYIHKFNERNPLVN